MKYQTLTALAIVAMATFPATAANWSDTYLGYQYSSQFKDPGIEGKEVKNRLELSGVYGWDYGTNFFDVTMLAASHRDPANDSNGLDSPNVPGDTEVYCVYRTSLDLGKTFKTSMAFGPVREVDFTAGFDFDSTDNNFASNKKFIMAGPQLNFNVSKGFWNLGVAACREQNYNGIYNVQKEVDFRTTYMIFTAWGKNFDLGVPVEFKGWANYIGPKGNDGFGNATVAETVGDMYLMFDVSSVIGRKKGACSIGPGFEFWNNKFGDKNATSSNPYNNNQQVDALMLCAEFHF